MQKSSEISKFTVDKSQLLGYTHVVVEKITTLQQKGGEHKMPEMDYSRLRGRIVECGLTQKECAEKIGVSEGQLNRKLAGEFAFRQDEISRICTLLSIPNNKIGHYFFCPKS